jgi:hypothetical protein
MRSQKITFGEMGVRGVLVYCADYHCSHSVAINADRWPDGERLSDIEPRFVCAACGNRGRGSAGFQLEHINRPGHDGPPKQQMTEGGLIIRGTSREKRAARRGAKKGNTAVGWV